MGVEAVVGVVVSVGVGGVSIAVVVSVGVGGMSGIVVVSVGVGRVSVAIVVGVCVGGGPEGCIEIMVPPHGTTVIFPEVCGKGRHAGASEESR